MPPESIAAPETPTAPVAPQAPAPQTEPAQPSTPAAPRSDPWSAAKADLVSRAVAAPTGTPESTDPATPSWTLQPRAPDGKWTAGDPPPDDGTEPTDEPIPNEATSDEVASVTSGTDEGAEPIEAAATDDTPVIQIDIPGIREGDEPITVDADDPATAERLRFLINNGMRREEFSRRMEAIETREAKQREFEARLSYLPETVIDAMPAEARERTMQYLLANHFDELRPTIETWWTDDAARVQKLLEMERGQKQTTADYQAKIAADKRVSDIRRALQTFIPAHATSDDAADFERDAMNDLYAIAQSGRDVTVEQLPALLSKRLTRYGWTPASASGTAATTSAPGASSSSPSVAARPVGDAATELAEAKRQQERLKAAQTQRNRARQVAPQGAGAQAATLPKPPLDWDGARKWVREHANQLTPAPTR